MNCRVELLAHTSVATEHETFFFSSRCLSTLLAHTPPCSSITLCPCTDGSSVCLPPIEWRSSFYWQDGCFRARCECLSLLVCGPLLVRVPGTCEGHWQMPWRRSSDQCTTARRRAGRTRRIRRRCGRGFWRGGGGL